MQAVTIRFATAADFKAVYDFINLLEDQVMDEAVQHRVYLDNLEYRDIIYLVAAIDGKSVGFLSCHIQNLMHHGGKIGEIQELYVAENARSLGIGKQLTDKVKEIAKDRNVIQIEVTSRLSRALAHRFYEREGFTFTHKKFLHKL